MKSHLIFLCLLVFVLVACATTPSVLSTQEFSPTPSLTPTPIPDATITASPTREPLPTINPYPTIIGSPDGKLLARMHINWVDPYEKPVIEICDPNGLILWEIPYQWDWDPFRAPPLQMTVYGWSPDSSKLYFYYLFYYDSGAPTLGYVRDLQTFDIHTGKVEATLPISSGSPTSFSFSEDMNKIAFIDGDYVSILNFVTRSKRSIKILTDEFNDAGWVFLSPSEKWLIYHTDKFETGVFAIAVDLQTMKQEIFWQGYDIFYFTFDGWTGDENPRYIDSTHHEQSVLVIDLKIHSQIMLGTATPNP